MFYWLLKHVLLGPVLRLIYRPKATGLENIPAEGPIILAANHVSFMDSLFIPLMVDRRVVFLGKADYFASPKTRWFFKAVNVIPVKREGGTAGEAAIQAGVRELRRGQVVGIYPEGTRSPDGRLYRGKTGVGRMALLADCPVIPVAVLGTRGIQPPEKKMPRVRGRVEVVYGKPLRFDRFRGKDRDRFVLRSVTDEIMYETMMLSGQEYVDEYASKVKARLSEAADRSGASPTPSDPGAPATVTDGAEGSAARSDDVHVTVRTRPSDSPSL
jgi:1-acyl-sn-glycerol-3-phosphate acyltransferase